MLEIAYLFQQRFISQHLFNWIFQLSKIYYNLIRDFDIPFGFCIKYPLAVLMLDNLFLAMQYLPFACRICLYTIWKVKIFILLNFESCKSVRRTTLKLHSVSKNTARILRYFMQSLFAFGVFVDFCDELFFLHETVYFNLHWISQYDGILLALFILTIESEARLNY